AIPAIPPITVNDTVGNDRRSSAVNRVISSPGGSSVNAIRTLSPGRSTTIGGDPTHPWIGPGGSGSGGCADNTRASCQPVTRVSDTCVAALVPVSGDAQSPGSPSTS